MPEEFKEKLEEKPAENPVDDSSKNPPENPEEKLLPLKEYLKLEEEEILSPFNEYVTGEALKRPVTKKDMEEHYVENKGPENFAQKHVLKGRGKKEDPK